MITYQSNKCTLWGTTPIVMVSESCTCRPCHCIAFSSKELHALLSMSLYSERPTPMPVTAAVSSCSIESGMARPILRRFTIPPVSDS